MLWTLHIIIRDCDVILHEWIFSGYKNLNLSYYPESNSAIAQSWVAEPSFFRWLKEWEAQIVLQPHLCCSRRWTAQESVLLSETENMKTVTQKLIRNGLRHKNEPWILNILNWRERVAPIHLLGSDKEGEGEGQGGAGVWVWSSTRQEELGSAPRCLFVNRSNNWCFSSCTTALHLCAINSGQQSKAFGTYRYINPLRIILEVPFAALPLGSKKWPKNMLTGSPEMAKWGCGSLWKLLGFVLVCGGFICVFCFRGMIHWLGLCISVPRLSSVPWVLHRAWVRP